MTKHIRKRVRFFNDNRIDAGMQTQRTLAKKVETRLVVPGLTALRPAY